MKNAQAKGEWTKHAGGPVLGGPDMGTCFDVFALTEEEEYRLYFSWRPRKSLAVVMGTDGIHWSDTHIILAPKLETGWEDDLNRNAVVKRDGLYHMWYCGQARGYTKIGYATSLDGIRRNHGLAAASAEPDPVAGSRELGC